MKNVVLTLFALAMTVVMGACSGNDDGGTSMSEQANKMSEKVAEAGSEAVEKLRTEFVESMKGKVDAIDGQLSELADRAEHLNPAVKKNIEKPLGIAKERVTTARNEITKLAEAPVDQWSEHKPQVEKALTDLQSSFEKVKNLF